MLEQPPLKFYSPSRHKRMESTYHRASHPRLCSALSVSHTLDGLLLHTPRGLVSSHCHVRDFTSGDFPAAKPAHLIGESSPLVVVEILLTASCPAAARSTRFASRVLSEQRSVVEDRGFRPATYSIPSRVFSSLRLSFGHLGDAFTPPPFMTFCAVRSLYPRRQASNVSISNRPDGLSPDHLPVRASRPPVPSTRR
jgi:hypothetical protein